jgi:hypothetical protein
MKYILILVAMLSLKIGAFDDSGKDHTPRVSVNLAHSEDYTHTLLGCVKISDEDYNRCSEKLISFISTLTISPKACELLHEIAERYGTIRLCLPTDTYTGAHWIKATRTICIARDYTNSIYDFYCGIIWELCNAGNNTLHIPLSLIKCCGNQDVYAFLTEACEFYSVLRRNQIVKDYFERANDIPQIKEAILRESAKGATLDDISDHFVKKFENFMQYWHSVNKKRIGKMLHSDVYREYYHVAIHYLNSHDSILCEDGETIQVFALGGSFNSEASSLIVDIFSQLSFELAKQETQMLHSYFTEDSVEREQPIVDNLVKVRNDLALRLVLGMAMGSQLIR